MCISLTKRFTYTYIPCIINKNMAVRQSSDMAKFKEKFKAAKDIVILSGAGISAESGIPTFRGAGGYWRKYQASSLATPEAFRNNPSLVWEFYHYRREVAAKAQPNAGHIAIANYESKHGGDKRIQVITQNVDGLHAKAGTKNLIELHGNLYKTRCTKCKEVLMNTDNPICEALANRGAPDENIVGSDIPVNSLPHCKKANCKGLLRPHIVWFGENLEPAILERAESAMATCDVCLVVGTSSVVYPAAMFAPQAAARGAVVAEFNIEPTPATSDFHYYFEDCDDLSVPIQHGNRFEESSVKMLPNEDIIDIVANKVKEKHMHKRIIKAIYENVELDLLKDMRFLSTLVGLGFAFMSDVTYLAMEPMLLFSYGFSEMQVAACVMVGAVADLIARFILAVFTYFYTVESRTIFFVGTCITILLRIGKFMIS